MAAPAVEDAAGRRGWGVLMASAAQLAAWLGVEARGPAREIGRVSGMEGADSTAVVFATDGPTLARALDTAAGVILAAASLLPEAGPETVDTRVLWVLDARYAFARAAQFLTPPAPPAGVHPSAVVGMQVRVGAGTRIGAGTVIGDGVQIGEGCTIDARVVVYAGTEIGHRVVVQAGAVLGSSGFGYVRDPGTGEYLAFPQQGRLVIESDVEIGANTTIDRGALGETRIGRGSKLDNLVHIGHNVRIGRDVILAAQTGVSGSSVIEAGAIVAGQVGIAEHVTIGPGVILGAKCGVPTGKKLRGPGEVFWGIPARPIREYLRDLAKLRRLRG